MLAELIVAAYPEDSPYAIKPSNLQGFEEMVATMQDSIDTGIPDSTESHEKSAVTRYWQPYCVEMGMDYLRPPFSSLSPTQRRAEDNMKAMFLLWVHARMKGVKQLKADPNSVMAVLRHVVNMLDRVNDEKTYANKPRQVLKGMLTSHVAEFGPLLPDQSLAPPKPVITALLNLPNGTKLGSYTLQWDDHDMVDFRAMYEVSLQSGVRLEEVSVGIKRIFDKRKMSRRSLMWQINGQVVISPTLDQLKTLQADRNDGAILIPACSKADRWGNKHGHKAMFFPYNPNHTWNAASALRNMEITRPILLAADREQAPLFRLTDNTAYPATRVRTLLHYMYSHPLVMQQVPREHVNTKGKPKYSFHSGRKLFATSLAKAGADRARIQSMARWLSEDSVDLYDQLTLQDNARYVMAAYNNCPKSITPALLRKMKDVPLDNNDVYIAWAQECHVDITAMPLDW